MTTIKLKFRPSSQPEAAGTLYYQVTHQRTTKWIATCYHLFPNEWDKKTERLIVPSSGERKGKLRLLQSTIDSELNNANSSFANGSLPTKPSR